VEHDLDPIPMVPPDLPSLGFNFKDQGQLVAISKTGEVTFKWQETTLEEYEKRAKNIAHMQKLRDKELTKSLHMKPFSLKGIKDSLEEIGNHLEKVHDEWKDHLINLYDDHGMRMDDHMPIFYCVKLWNNMLK